MQMRFFRWVLVFGLFLLPLGVRAAATSQPIKGALTTADDKPPRLDFLEPGFTVQQLPVQLTNMNNVEYAQDGRLFAVGYNGKVYLLRDKHGTGVEDSAELYFQGTGDYETPLGLVVRDNRVWITFRGRIEELRRAGDGSIKTTAVATGWHDPITDTDKTFLHRRVDDAIGLAIDANGNYFTSLGTPNYQNLYQLVDGVSHYQPQRYRGSVIRIGPDGKPQIVATGVRFLVSMQFNRHGDLFATDQEGATWGPGNPLDKLIQILPNRHYGFPPHDDKYLPDVVDEPSIADFGPQHQSSCGFRFDETKAGFARFGPQSWEGCAIVTGESRGKLWRVPLVKTRGGYMGKPILIAALNMLAVDVAISQAGDLIVTCHGGKPDWGSGPNGQGKLFKIRYAANEEPRLAAVWPASLSQVRAALTAAPPADAILEASIVGGRYVRAGDDLETFRPGYKVIASEQIPAPRHTVRVNRAYLTPDRRTAVLETSLHPWLGNYALMLKWNSPSTGRSGTLRADYDFSGVQASWTAQGHSQPDWRGWLPHPNLDVARAFTVDSSEHDALFDKLSQPGVLTLSGMLMPTAFESGGVFDVLASAPGSLRYAGEHVAISPDTLQRLKFKPDALPFQLQLTTGGAQPLMMTMTTVSSRNGSEHPLARASMNVVDAPAIAAPGAPAQLPKGVAFTRGDASHGKEIFQANCVACHTLHGQGGHVGPDLSNSSERDPAGLLVDIVNPNATINPDYLAYAIQLDTGEQLLGTVTSSAPDHYQIHQANVPPIDVDRSRIRSMRQLSTSLMPVGFEALGDSSLRDLIMYLTTARP